MPRGVELVKPTQAALESVFQDTVRVVRYSLNFLFLI